MTKKHPQSLAALSATVQILMGLALPVLGWMFIDHLDVRDKANGAALTLIQVQENQKGIQSGMNEQLRLMNELAKRIAVIQANRFTSADGAAMAKEMSQIWKELSDLRGAIPTEIPPKWFEEDVKDLKDAMKEVTRTVTSLQLDVKDLQKRVDNGG